MGRETKGKGKGSIATILFAIIILLVTLVAAIDFIPQGDINLVNYWNIKNISNILGNLNVTNYNVTAAYFYGDGSKLSGLAGGGDINAVNTPGEYLYGGATSGDVTLYMNETRLNATIDGRGAGGDISAVYTQGPYLHNGSASGDVYLGLNETYLFTRVNTLENDTTYSIACGANRYVFNLTSAGVAECRDDLTDDSVSSSELDNVCTTDDKILKRSAGTWGCSDDSDTTYSNGTGINLAGTQFNHSDTSAQASSNNAGRTYIQDIILDTFGHITSIVTATETVVNSMWSITGPYLYNNSGSMDLNETKLNATIDSRASGLDTNCTADDTCTLILYDSLFSTAGLMKTDGAGAYSIIPDNSTHWQTAYVWGEHGAVGYYNSITNFTGTLTDTKWCVYDLANTEIDCNVDPVTDTDTWWGLNVGYVYNNSNSLDFNESRLNATINALENDTTYDFECSAGDYVKNLSADGSYVCGTPAGGGDITAVNTPGSYLYNGSASGDVAILVNETYLDTRINSLENDTKYTHLSNFSDDIGVSSDWDDISDVPTATPSNGDITHLSTADQIYDWVISLSYITNAASDLVSYYLKTEVYNKTEIDTQGEMETIWGVTLATDTELAAQDECSEITGCVDGAYSTEGNLTGLLDDNYVNISGDTMTGNLAMGAKNITNIDTIYFNTTTPHIYHNGTHLILTG